MTNEEKKSNEIAAEYLLGHDRFEITYEEMREAVLEMAKWKDQQFKEYLEKKLEWAKGNRDSSNLNDPQWHDYVVQAETYREIINELFGHTEQDNSDREE